VTSAELDAPLMPYGEALGRITGAFTPLPPLRVPLASALGLVLADDIVAADDIPAFDNSAMDGTPFVPRTSVTPRSLVGEQCPRARPSR
jgi:molybdopterin biosynthesis enzyme